MTDTFNEAAQPQTAPDGFIPCPVCGKAFTSEHKKCRKKLLKLKTPKP